MAHVTTIVFKIVRFRSENNNRFLSTTHWAAFSRCLGAPRAHKQHTSTHQVTAQHDDLSAPSKTSRHKPSLPSNQNEENLLNTLSQKRAYAEPKPHQAVPAASKGPWDITEGTAWSCGGKTEKAMTYSRFHCKTEGGKIKKPFEPVLVSPGNPSVLQQCFNLQDSYTQNFFYFYFFFKSKKPRDH